MKRIESRLNTASAEFQANAEHNRRLAAEFRDKQENVRHARPQRDIDRLRSQNKLLVRERLDLLLDPGTPFLEFSSLAANEAYGGEVPAAACVTGIGIVSGREVVINAGDASVKGGAWYPLTVKKTVHLCDSAGGFLPLQADLFADKYMAGRIFRNQCMLSKMGVQQVSVVLGHCTAGGAYVPGLSDYNVIVRGTGAIFLAGPPLVKAATGEDVSVDELGGCDMHTSVSGTAG
jgi:3-methylcrotonyl-CoA carboxylase beta subunit